jgi:hypothetical protein
MIIHEGRLKEACVGIGPAIRHTMRRVSWRRVPGTLYAAVWLFLLAGASPAFGQAHLRPCRPASERTGEPGPTCSTANQKLGRLPQATGTVRRRGVVLILHDSSQPATTMGNEWTPKGLCKRYL